MLFRKAAIHGDETPYRRLEEIFAFLVDSSKDVFARDSGLYFDIDNLLPCYLLLNFTNNRDAVHMNQYITLSPDGMRVTIVPWDYDKIFLKRKTSPLANHLFARYLHENPVFLEKAKERWTDLVNGQYSNEALMARIESYAEILAPYMDEEWRLLKPAGFDGGFADAIADLKDAVRNQLSFMDQVFLK